MEGPVLKMGPGPLSGAEGEYANPPGSVETAGPGICSQHPQGLGKVHFQPLTGSPHPSQEMQPGPQFPHPTPMFYLFCLF